MGTTTSYFRPRVTSGAGAMLKSPRGRSGRGHYLTLVVVVPTTFTLRINTRLGRPPFLRGGLKLNIIL